MGDERVHDQVRKELAGLFGQEALVDKVSRGIYATDASVYQFEPIAVVTPCNAEEIASVVRLARERHVPLLMRGGGTSLAGQTANHAIVVDVSKHMNKLLETNEKERWARVEPGLVRDELNAKLAPLGLEFSPETSTSNRANIGGMIGNNSSGTRSIRYRRTLEHILETKIMLANGAVIDCVPRTREEVARLMEGDSEEGKIWRAVSAIVTKNRELIEKRFPKVIRRVGGYSLDEFPEEGPWNLAKLICGSEGTLGVILEAKVKLSVAPKHVGMMALHFHDLIEGLRTVPALLEHDPLSVELLDGEMIRLSRNNPSTRGHCAFIQGEPAVILTVEVEGSSPDDVVARLDRLEADAKSKGFGYAHPRMTSKADQFEVLELRRKGLGVSLSVPGDTKPVSWIEDACVPVQHLADYTEKVLQIAGKHGLKTVIYGHASVGVLHIKPALNLKSGKDIKSMAEFSKEVMEVCRSYGGSWSGEHGDGVARGAQNREFWGEEMYQVFCDLKAAFDPKNILNPNRIIDSPPVNENLRYGTHYKVRLPKTHFRFRETGGFAPAVEMCNGVGACRKTLGGTMCPSYMATREEQDSTRGRANALRLAMSGRFGQDGLTSERVHDVLDLCLECKACKSECPSNVDMARMKSEHLAHYHAVHGTTLRDKVFAHAPIMGRMFSGPVAPLVNAPLKVGALRRFMMGMIGVARERKLPAYATQTLESWFRKRTEKRAPGSHGREVVLFADCWANYHETGTGRWAVRVLEHLGYSVTLVGGVCCQRTRISKGFLEEAKRDGAESIRKLVVYADRGATIVGIEPSCVSSLTDDLPDLVENVEEAKRVAKAAMPIEEFLQREIAEGRIPSPKQAQPAPSYLVHGHCHQKAVFSTSPAKALLAAEGSTVTEVDSGCCGMAGSFGYEQEHYDLSQKIGERRLFPAVRETKDTTVVVANGFSCRHQVADATGRKPMHIIEAFGRALLGKWHKE